MTPFERREEIYAICREYDIILLEDDPYFYLQYAPGGGEPKGLQDLGRSYLSMDTDCRVVRIDSFSKVGKARSIDSVRFSSTACFGRWTCWC